MSVVNADTDRMILNALITDQRFARKVLPELRKEYFQNLEDRIIYAVIDNHYTKYQQPPSGAAIVSIIRKIDKFDNLSISDDLIHSTCQSVNSVLSIPNDKVSQQWLIDTAEEFCKDQALHNAIKSSIEIYDGDSKLSRGDIPDLMKNALKVSFDKTVGHDYLDDASARYDYYNRSEELIPFDLDMMNKITNGGITRKTMNIVMAATGVGKSLLLCHLAANYLRSGYNVIYISCEMAEEKLAQRIDANLLATGVNTIKDMPKGTYLNRMQKLRERIRSKLIIKEYPTVSADVNDFRGLLDELSLKKSFKPDVIIIDYLNICCSSRFKGAANLNSYNLVKAIAEEVRGLAIETNTAIWSATQTNRSGIGNMDLDLTATSDSMGTPMTADLMLSISRNEELDKKNQAVVKQLKNRYGDIGKNTRFLIGLDRDTMTFHDISENAQIVNIDEGLLSDLHEEGF